MKKMAKGFTLIELMIVVAIIAILAAVALPSFGNQVKKSKDGKAVQIMGTMRSQLGMVIADLDGYNPTAESVNNAFQNGGGEVQADGATTVTVSSIGIQKFGTTGFPAQITGAGSGTMSAGTPPSVNWSYANGTGAVAFSDSTTDTKGKTWTNY